MNQQRTARTLKEVRAMSDEQLHVELSGHPRRTRKARANEAIREENRYLDRLVKVIDEREDPR